MSLTDGIVDTCPGVLNGAPANIFLALINSLFAAQCSLQPPFVPDYGPQLKNGDKFDFIVVGGGAAGAVVANRLSENPKWNVLLLEAGTDPSVTSQVPALSFNTIDSPEDWNFKSQSQPGACQGTENKQCDWTCGKALGGSTTINTMLYIRGNKRDFDTWAQDGNTGWDFDNVLTYFKKSEDNQQFRTNNRYHSTGGYLKVGYFRNGSNPLQDIITKSAFELGYPEVQDFNSEKWIGYGKIQGTVNDGIRQSTCTAFLVPVEQRPNLFIAKNALGTRVTFNKKAANGVNVIINQKEITLNAKKEVIISGGALNTPKILMLSGIGPKKHLDKLKIPVVKDLPVGQNLQDHLAFQGMFIALRAHQEDVDDTSSDLDTIYQYFLNRKGPLAGVGLLDFMGFLNTDARDPYPNIQFEHIYFQKGQFDADSSVLKSIGYSDDLNARIIEINRNQSFFVPLLKVLNPKSRGHVLLKSKDPQDMPLFYPNYLTEKDDVDHYLRGIRHIERLLATPTFSRYKPEFIDIGIPECNSHKIRSDDYWKCYLKYMGVSDYHYSGTCKMGKGGDKSAVVDPRLRVKGIKGLRVCDASIMPRITSGNTMAPSIMIGEKASDMIKEDWK